MKNPKSTLIAAAALGAITLPASAAVTIDWVTVGDAGNAADNSTGYGAVAYEYKIGKYEVTLGQYTEFLNAADPTGTNTRSLYNGNMATDTVIAGISYDAGAAAGAKYSVIGSSLRPVTYVSWFDAARFCNWMQNGQGSGDTETGVYALNGATSGVSFAASPGALYHLPTEDEWYKAAYYDPTPGASGNNYWLYPTQSDGLGGNAIGAAAGANYFDGNYALEQNGLPTYLTDVGVYGLNSDSYYGTLDQGGNVWEWNDAVIDSSRGLRGGSWGANVFLLQSSVRGYDFPTNEYSFLGFRLASVPEPSSVLMAGLGGMALLTRRRRPTL